MSGNVFKDDNGKALSSIIRLSNVEPTLDNFLVNHLKLAGIHKFELIGSTGKREYSGDIDILLDLQGVDKRVFKNNLAECLIKTLPSKHVRVVGSIISVLFPISNSAEGRMVQIDIMMADNVADAAWLMTGTAFGVRGSFRNTMLAYLANKVSERLPPRQKVTISFPGGLQLKELPEGLDPDQQKNKRKFVGIEDKITNPQQILDRLGIDSKPELTTRFEDLVDAINSDYKLKNLLSGFYSYVELSRFDKTGSDDAIEYINSVI